MKLELDLNECQLLLDMIHDGITVADEMILENDPKGAVILSRLQAIREKLSGA